jgi:hypothetical protein
MSVTAMAWILAYCAAAVMSFSSPLYGVLGYLLEYYQRPELRWWGKDLPGLRWNLMISVILAITFIMKRSSLREMAVVRNLSLRWLTTLVVVMAFVTVTVSVSFDSSSSWMIQWTKMALIFPLLVIGVIRTPVAFDAFIGVHMAGAFTWGWVAWLDPKRAEGRLMSIGSGDSFNDNFAAAHLLTVLPFTIIYLFASKDKRLRLIALAALPFVINTIILCNSRGAILGVAVAMCASFVLIRSGYRMRMIAAAVVMLGIGFALADDTFINRQQTTADYEDDGSAQERLLTWQGGLQLARDHPLGVGGRGFHLLSPIYIPEIVDAHGGDLRAPHNTYVMVLAEWGVVGLICYVGIWLSTFVMLERVKRRSTPAEQGFYYWRAFAIQLAVIAYLVAGAFSDRLYGEAGYWMVALSYSLYRIQVTEQASSAKALEPVAQVDMVVESMPWRLADLQSR